MVFNVSLYYGSLLLQHARHSPSARNRNGGLIHTVLFSTTHVCAWCLAGGGTDGPLIVGFGGCAAIFGVFGWCLFSTSTTFMNEHDCIKIIYTPTAVTNSLTHLTGRQGNSMPSLQYTSHARNLQTVRIVPLAVSMAKTVI